VHRIYRTQSEFDFDSSRGSNRARSRYTRARVLRETWRFRVTLRVNKMPSRVLSRIMDDPKWFRNGMPKWNTPRDTHVLPGVCRETATTIDRSRSQRRDHVTKLYANFPPRHVDRRSHALRCVTETRKVAGSRAWSRAVALTIIECKSRIARNWRWSVRLNKQTRMLLSSLALFALLVAVNCYSRLSPRSRITSGVTPRAHLR